MSASNRPDPSGATTLSKRDGAGVSRSTTSMLQTLVPEGETSAEVEGILPDLAELCRVYDVGLEMIERSHDPGELLDRILDEYEKRLAELPGEALDGREAPISRDSAKKLRALIMFATQATALKEKAVAAADQRLRARALEEAKAQLETALEETRVAQRELDGVLAALDAGIMIVDSEGRVRRANRAADELMGRRDEGGDSISAEPVLSHVPRGADGEVRLGGESESGRTLLVARRNLAANDGAEVVLLSDITEHARSIEERHRIEKLAEVLRTLSVLAHKINNPLTALLGRAQMLKAIEGTDPRVVKAATVIEESGARIAELIRELARVVKEGNREAVEKVLDIGPPSAGGTGEGS